MNKAIIELVEQDYNGVDVQKAIYILSSLTLEHVMGYSAINLFNARMAILKLADGNIQELEDYTEKAKIDFRDVIYWATL